MWASSNCSVGPDVDEEGAVFGPALDLTGGQRMGVDAVGDAAGRG